MVSNRRVNFPLIILIIIFASAGIYFFAKAVAMSASFSLLGGSSKPIENVGTSSGATNSTSQQESQTDVSSFFQDKDPFQKKCDNGSGGTSVSSNTVCIK